MNQPFKPGVPTFKMPVGFFDDVRLMLAEDAVKKNYPDLQTSLSTPVIAVKLWCAILSKNYFLQWDDKQSVQFAKAVGHPVTLDIIEAHLNSLADSLFIDKDLWINNKIVTSKEIQKAWCQEIKNRRRSSEILPEHNLILNERSIAQ